MPICFSCGKSCDKLAPTGLCPDCAGTSSRPTPSIDPELVGLSSIERSQILHQRATAESERRAMADRLNSLASRGYDGYYEYKVINMCDHISGVAEVDKITFMLNDMGLDGWRLCNAYSNDLSLNTFRMAGISFAGSMSQNILIFERFVRLESHNDS